MSEHLKTKDNILLCPICNEDYLHIEHLILGTGDYKIHMVEGTTTITHSKCTEPNITRGAVIQIMLDCESCGESSELDLRFHKGQILIESHVSNTKKRSDLWRD